MVGIKKTVSALALSLFLSLPGFAAEDSYPHISALEQEILGQTYASEALPQRLSRMEMKAFGIPSQDSDLSTRTDSLENYCQKVLGKKPFGADPGYATDEKYADESKLNQVSNGQNYDQDPADDSPQAKYPHIDSLEKSILGQTHTTDSVEARLARMETKAFGKSSDNQALVDRTDALEDYAEKTLHKQSFAQEQKQEAAAYGGVPVEAAAQSAGRPGKGALMSMAASSLLNLAAGPLMPGFGGINMIPRSAVAQSQAQTETPAEAHPDDPAVKAATPPPSGANMQTRVGWCEMQLFGHTCHNMHLMDRLKQINDELNYAQHKKPLELMDDMDGITKAVVAKKGTTGKTAASTAQASSPVTQAVPKSP